MKSALSLTLIVCLCGPAIPLAAQETLVESTSGPVTRAIPREAGRLALALQTSVDDSGWSRVLQLAPGTEIIVTVKGSPSARRYFIAGEDSGLTVSIVTDSRQIETIARADIAEIKTPLPYSPGHDALMGLIVGSVAYGLIGVSLCKAFAGTGSCAGDVAKVSALGGGYMAGISVATGAVKHAVKKSTRVIYRAP